MEIFLNSLLWKNYLLIVSDYESTQFFYVLPTIIGYRNYSWYLFKKWFLFWSKDHPLPPKKNKKQINNDGFPSFACQYFLLICSSCYYIIFCIFYLLTISSFLQHSHFSSFRTPPPPTSFSSPFSCVSSLCYISEVGIVLDRDPALLFNSPVWIWKKQKCRVYSCCAVLCSVWAGCVSMWFISSWVWDFDQQQNLGKPSQK